MKRNLLDRGGDGKQCRFASIDGIKIIERRLSRIDDRRAADDQRIDTAELFRRISTAEQNIVFCTDFYGKIICKRQ